MYEKMVLISYYEETMASVYVEGNELSFGRVA
jgi:hypothetical protein